MFSILEAVFMVPVLLLGATLNLTVIKLKDQVPPMVKRSLNDFVVLVQCWLAFTVAVSEVPIVIGLALSQVQRKEGILPVNKRNIHNGITSFKISMDPDR